MSASTPIAPAPSTTPASGKGPAPAAAADAAAPSPLQGMAPTATPTAPLPLQGMAAPAPGALFRGSGKQAAEPAAAGSTVYDCAREKVAADAAIISETMYLSRFVTHSAPIGAMASPSAAAAAPHGPTPVASSAAMTGPSVASPVCSSADLYSQLLQKAEKFGYAMGADLIPFFHHSTLPGIAHEIINTGLLKGSRPDDATYDGALTTMIGAFLMANPDPCNPGQIPPLAAYPRGAKFSGTEVLRVCLPASSFDPKDWRLFFVQYALVSATAAKPSYQVHLALACTAADAQRCIAAGFLELNPRDNKLLQWSDARGGWSCLYKRYSGPGDYPKEYFYINVCVLGTEYRFAAGSVVSGTRISLPPTSKSL